MWTAAKTKNGGSHESKDRRVGRRGSVRVKLIKTLSTEDLPLGIEGFILGSTKKMALVKWDNGMVIAMYKSEIESVAK